MPIVHFFGLGRSVKKRRALVEGLTEAVAEAYEIPKEIVTVYVFDAPEDTVAHAGRLYRDGGRKTTPKGKPWLAHEY